MSLGSPASPEAAGMAVLADAEGVAPPPWWDRAAIDATAVTAGNKIYPKRRWEERMGTRAWVILVGLREIWAR